MLAQWHVTDPGHSAKSAGGRLHQNTQVTHKYTYTPNQVKSKWADYVVQANIEWESLRENELLHNSSAAVVSGC